LILRLSLQKNYNMAKEFKRNSGKDSKNNRSDSKKGKDPKKGKKPSFERYRDESRPSDFGSSSPRRSSPSYSDDKRKLFNDKPAFRKKRDDDNLKEEKSSFRGRDSEKKETPDKPLRKKTTDFSNEKPVYKQKRSVFADKPSGDKPSFRKRQDDKKETRSKRQDDDFYDSRPSFVRESDQKDFDYEEEFQSGKKRADSVDYKKRNEGKTIEKENNDSGLKKVFRDKKDDGNFSRPYKKRPFEKKSFGKGSSSKPQKVNDDGTIRLNKYISNAGICSRREADELIESGVVQVNGKIITEMGYKVKPTDIIKYGGQTLKKERLVYLILNKPKDYITTVDDPHQRKTVQELVQGACRERIYPVGRLDRATTGLLMFTNDGELTKKLTHPRYGVRKVYHVELDKPLKRSDLDKISEGLELEDGQIKVDEVSYVGDGKDKANVGIELHSGKNRIVRRIFEHLGYNVRKLDRVVLGPLTKKDLPRGRWRLLTDAEVGMLKMISSD
jgi:23S rRNA pseudouridine2605 synthase